ncbi:MAG: hypothetical protein GX045_07435 [Clostridiaceae bacterium]|nr:hypothetical protein [Clostridiaceae bacterium]
MKGFDYHEVKLNEGLLKDTLDETMNFFLRIPNDNILKYMREDAGLPAPGIYYTGWFKNSRGMGVLGQWISAYARMYAITGNKSFREKALYLIDEFWKCYLILKGTPKRLLSHRSFYAFEKLLRALIDLHVYCGYETAKEKSIEIIAFAVENFSTENLFGDNGTEWYTLPESLYMAYELFGIEQAREAAGRWEYREWWDLFYKDLDPYSKRPKAGLYSEFCHAYSHTNSFNSCAMAYKVKKDPYYLRAICKYYDFIKNEQMMATGGYGPSFEHLMPKNRIIDALRCGHDSFETQCCSYAAFRLVHYLTCFTGNPHYSNWVELLLYNAVVATIPMTEDGKVIYYSDYNMYGAQKINRQDGWTCCTGTRPLVVTEMQRLIYFNDGEDLYIAQYTPSTLSWNRQGGKIVVHQKTGFPLTNETQIELQLESATEFAVKFRMPEWLAGKMTVAVNGTETEAMLDEHGWLSVSNVWKNGDTITVTLPQNVWMHSFDPIKEGPNAFLHGPVVLAATYTGPQTPNDHMNVRKLTQKMRPVEGKPLHYTVDGRDDLYFKPFYEYKEYERYFIYHDTTAHATKRFD